MPDRLPGPPEDYEALASSFPVLPKERVSSRLFRVHKMGNEPEWFGTSGNYRWDPPPTAADLFGTCYVGTAALTSLMETLGEFAIVTEGMIEARNVAALQVPDDIRLADLTNNRIVGDWGLDRRISVGDDYEICQLWGQALQSAGFEGIFYEARHHVGGHSIALFGDPLYQPRQVVLLDDDAISSELIEQAQLECGLRILPSSPLF
ncbi:MAG TPA: RES family NAD+ phosphorylase [Acidimicrobiales bacterium]